MSHTCLLCTWYSLNNNYCWKHTNSLKKRFIMRNKCLDYKYLKITKISLKNI